MHTNSSRDLRAWIWLPALIALALLFSSTAPGTAQASCRHANTQSDEAGKEKLRDAVHCLVNKERNARNLDDNGDLQDSAQDHSAYMKKRTCFSHVCAGEAALGTRIGRTGYFRGASSYGYGETIALNSDDATPRDIVKQFMNSPPHRAALMAGKYEHMGTGISVSGSRAWYTINLGYKSG